VERSVALGTVPLKILSPEGVKAFERLYFDFSKLYHPQAAAKLRQKIAAGVSWRFGSTKIQSPNGSTESQLTVCHEKSIRANDKRRRTERQKPYFSAVHINQDDLGAKLKHYKIARQSEFL
jgi:hypothetical protein